MMWTRLARRKTKRLPGVFVGFKNTRARTTRPTRRMGCSSSAISATSGSMDFALESRTTLSPPKITFANDVDLIFTNWSLGLTGESWPSLHCLRTTLLESSQHVGPSLEDKQTDNNLLLNRPKTSLYLPLHAETSPIESPPNHKDMTSTKRRSTMNSRDAAYDEAVLQRVLEESKSEAKASSSRGGTRGRKRGSSEGSEEYTAY